jgi:ribose-phosphate pyrophosphokinase
MVQKQLRLLSGTFNRKLAEDVAKELGAELSPVKLERFANGEIRCELGESVRGCDVFVFQAHSPQPNEAIMEQAIIIDACKRASAKRITAVCPFWGYGRQDRKGGGREPISAKLVVDVLAIAGADRFLSVDLHSGQIQGFFDGPFDHVTAMPVLLDYLRQNLPQDAVLVSPDAGRVKLSERYTKQLGWDMAIIHKVRSKKVANQAEARTVIGDVKGRRCVIIDDMIDTAGTIVAAADLLRREGATQLYVMSTHGLLSGPAIERLEAAPIDKVIVTDTIEVDTAQLAKLEQVSLAPLMASAVNAIYHDTSVSELFGGENQV